MLYGMTYEQFWFGDPWMTRAYAQAYLLKRRTMNEELWLEGIYLSKAFQTVIANAFSKNSREKYFDRPLEIFEKTKAEKEQEARAERQKLINYLNRLRQSADTKQGVGKNGEPRNT